MLKLHHLLICAAGLLAFACDDTPATKALERARATAASVEIPRPEPPPIEKTIATYDIYYLPATQTTRLDLTTSGFDCSYGATIFGLAIATDHTYTYVTWQTHLAAPRTLTARTWHSLQAEDDPP